MSDKNFATGGIIYAYVYNYRMKIKIEGKSRRSHAIRYGKIIRGNLIYHSWQRINDESSEFDLFFSKN